MNIAWFSGGATSAVACKLALEKYNDIILLYIETGSHHEDHKRFLSDCEKWYSQKIITLQSEKYSDVFDVIKKTRYINGPTGAACTGRLKKDVRKKFEAEHPEIKSQIWGFEYDKKEMNRAERHKANHPNTEHFFPLIEHKITKENALGILAAAGIELPAMYKLGYHNSNCLGCVKGGMAYWNKIRTDFPAVFEKTAQLEREIGRSCLRKYFLDELPLDAGRDQLPLVPDCGSVGEGCEIELSKLNASRE